MKIKPAIKPGHVTVELDSRDEELLEKAAGAKHAVGALKLKRILVPIDFSDCALKALDYAVVFAEPFQAKLILLHVIEPAAVYPEDFTVVPLPMEEANQSLVDAARDRLDGLARKRVGHKAPFETLVRVGRAFSEIPDTARALGADMIIIGTHGFAGLKHAVLGSTAEKVVRQSACPVLTVRQPDHGHGTAAMSRKDTGH